MWFRHRRVRTTHRGTEAGRLSHFASPACANDAQVRLVRAHGTSSANGANHTSLGHRPDQTVN